MWWRPEAVYRLPLHTDDILAQICLRYKMMVEGIKYAEGRTDMFVLKMILKSALLPVMLVLLFLRLLIRIGMEISSVVLGSLMLIVFICLVYTVIQQMWSSALVFTIIEASIVFITVGSGVIEALLQMLSEGLGGVIRSSK